MVRKPEFYPENPKIWSEKSLHTMREMRRVLADMRPKIVAMMRQRGFTDSDIYWLLDEVWKL